jgi:hypothetical protein
VAQFRSLLGVDNSSLSTSGMTEALGHALSVYGTMGQSAQALLIEKAGAVIERFVELLSPVPRRMRNEVVEGLRCVFWEYEGLDQAGKTMVEEKTIWAMSQCLERLDSRQDEKIVLQRQLLALTHLPKTIWESLDWMKTHTLEADLGL